MTYASAIGNTIIFKTVNFHASHVALIFVMVVALVCGHSRDFHVFRRVCRHVPSRVRIGVFCPFWGLENEYLL